jgi:hypothetical protein
MAEQLQAMESRVPAKVEHGASVVTSPACAGDGIVPTWCDSYLAPEASADFFSSRLWFGTLLRHALGPGDRAAFLRCPGDAAMLPLVNGRMSLTTPYSLEWRPLPRAGSSDQDLVAAGSALGRARRFALPLRLEAMDLDFPATRQFLEGVAASGHRVLRYAHFGNWHERLPDRTSWPDYLRARPPAMRSTIQRKLARAERTMRFELIAGPGPALEAGIADYEAVRAQSWKPPEPFPDFDRHLLRATASAGQVRLGILRDGATGEAVAAQYWVSQGRRAYLLKLCHLETMRSASPGTALTAMMIRALLEADAVTELDFGRGDDPYKQLWVGERRQRWGVVLASPWHPAGLAAIARHRASAWRRQWLEDRA